MIVLNVDFKKAFSWICDPEDAKVYSGQIHRIELSTQKMYDIKMMQYILVTKITKNFLF